MKGNYVSDGRMLFNKKDVESPRLLKSLLETDSPICPQTPQRVGRKTLDILKRTATQLLDFNSYTRYENKKDGGLVYIDCFSDKWLIQRRYYQLAKKLLNFDYILGCSDFRTVCFIKNNEIIGALMCFY